MTVVLLIISCGKDQPFENINEIDSRSRLINRSDNVAEELMSLSAELIAYEIANKPRYKDQLLRTLFSADGVPNRHLFLADVLETLDRNTFNQVSTVNSSEVVNYDDLVNKVRCDYPLLVVKVPDWSTIIFNDPNTSFSFDLIKELSVRPTALNVKESSTLAKAYEYEKGNINITDMTNNKMIDYIPVFIRFSEFHRVVNPNTLEDRFGVPIVEDDRIFPPDSPCNPSELVYQYVVKYLPCEDYAGDVVIDWFDFIWDYRSRECPEICGNNIDDDGDGYVDESLSCVVMTEDCTNGIDDNDDGLIDCEDPMCCDTPDCPPCQQAEICDNGIDDDGDGAIDEADADCCSFYAQCLRDCAGDMNYVEGLKIVSHLTAPVVNENILWWDVGHMKLVFYQFVGSGGAGAVTPNIKTMPFKFMTDCYNKLANDLSLRQHLFNAEIGCQPDENGSYWTGFEFLWVPFHPDCTYLNLTSTSPIIQQILWDNEWNGETQGQEVRCNIWFEDTKAVNISGGTSQTINTSYSTTSGGSFGTSGTVNTGGQNQGTSNNTTTGYNFSNQFGGGASWSSSFNYSISSVARDLGNVDLHYCESNEDIDVDLGCGGYPDYVWFHNGQAYSTGTCELFTSIEID